MKQRQAVEMKKTKKLQTKHLIFPIFAMTLMVGGCFATDVTVPTAPGTSGNTSLANFQPTTDIPIPAGARFDAKQSLVLSGQDYWTGRLVLAAQPNISQIFAFYQQEMPPLGWEPVASVLSTTSVLTFIRQNRTATVQIVPVRFGGSTIAVTVATRQPGNGGYSQPAAGGNILPPLSPANGFPQQQPFPAMQQTMPSPPPPDLGSPQTSQTAPVYQQQIPQVYSQQQSAIPQQQAYPLR